MKHRDPWSLITETAARIRRRSRANLLVPCLPPLAAALVLAAAGRLPIELAAAGAIAVGVVLIQLLSVPAATTEAAGRIDRLVGARDHFLTIATSERESHPFLRVVEAHAATLASDAKLADAAPPLAWRRFVRSALGSLAVFAVLAWGPGIGPFDVDPALRLETIADELARNGTREDRLLAHELRKVAETLRNPDRTREEKRAAAEAAAKRLEDEKGGGKGEQQGAKGDRQGSGAGGSESSALRGEARSELQKLAAQSDKSEGKNEGKSGGKNEGGKSEGGKSESAGDGSESRDEERTAEGGSVNAPRDEAKGAKPREDAGEGNRPDSAGDRGSSSKPGAAHGQREGGPPDPQRQGKAQGNQPQAGTEARGEGARPTTASEDEPAPKYEEGEGERGWRIEGGRYVRVRIPEEETDAAETDRVQKPGDPRPLTPYGNAPLPETGPAGEVKDRQPLPLEYRDVLTGKESR